MLDTGVSGLPVTDHDGGMLVGIVSRRDLLRSFHQAAADIAAGNTA
jgi:CBS domain-containing protein